MGNKKKESIGEDEESSDFRNPNAEDYVLQPGEKRVRFSICEATFAPQVNFAYEEDVSLYITKENSQFCTILYLFTSLSLVYFTLIVRKALTMKRLRG